MCKCEYGLVTCPGFAPHLPNSIWDRALDSWRRRDVPFRDRLSTMQSCEVDLVLPQTPQHRRGAPMWLQISSSTWRPQGVSHLSLRACPWSHRYTMSTHWAIKNNYNGCWVTGVGGASHLCFSWPTTDFVKSPHCHFCWDLLRKCMTPIQRNWDHFLEKLDKLQCLQGIFFVHPRKTNPTPQKTNKKNKHRNDFIFTYLPNQWL